MKTNSTYIDSALAVEAKLCPLQEMVIIESVKKKFGEDNVYYNISDGHIYKIEIRAKCSYYNDLPDISEVSNLSGLKTLELCYCGLSQVPEWISSITGLEELFLEGNMFKSLPESMKSLKNLKCLNLGYNYNLTQIPKWIHNLENLEHMNLWHTRVETLPYSIAAIPNLTIHSDHFKTLGGNEFDIFVASMWGAPSAELEKVKKVEAIVLLNDQQYIENRLCRDWMYHTKDIKDIDSKIRERIKHPEKECAFTL